MGGTRRAWRCVRQRYSIGHVVWGRLKQSLPADAPRPTRDAVCTTVAEWFWMKDAQSSAGEGRTPVRIQYPAAVYRRIGATPLVYVTGDDEEFDNQSAHEG